ncbi:hypothetical protein, partial [Clostridioides difficile]|uniref:hypothetical protein n=1 Tax=Clostridioides difficile TaxID=1496 RepID=UPI001A9AD350
LRFDPEKTFLLQRVLIENSVFWWLSLSALLCNLAFVGIFLSRTVNLERQGSKLQVLQGEKPKWTIARAELWAGIGSMAAYFSARRSVVVEVAPLLLRVVSNQIVSLAATALSLNLALAFFFVLRLVLPWFGRLKL